MGRMDLAFGSRATNVLRQWAVQGKPVVRRGRKARDLGLPRPPGRRTSDAISETRCIDVKANLARFTTALAVLATMALSLGAGIRWF